MSKNKRIRMEMAKEIIEGYLGDEVAYIPLAEEPTICEDGSKRYEYKLFYPNGKEGYLNIYELSEEQKKERLKISNRRIDLDKKVYFEIIDKE